MNNNLIKFLKEEFHDSIFTKKEDNSYIINNVLTKGFKVVLNPKQSNDFVIDYSNFNFFNKKQLALFLTKKLSHNGVKFKISTNRIYIYIDHKHHDSYSIEVFKYVKDEIDVLIYNILKVISLD